MRQAVVIVLVLAVLAVGAGMLVYSIGWLAPVLASEATVTGDTPVDVATSSIAVPSMEQVGATGSTIGSELEAEMATFTQGGEGLCDHAKGASSGGY